MKFGEALEAIQEGKVAARPVWKDNGGHMLIADSLVQWQSSDHPPQVFHPTTEDMLASDWEAAEA